MCTVAGGFGWRCPNGAGAALFEGRDGDAAGVRSGCDAAAAATAARGWAAAERGAIPGAALPVGIFFALVALARREEGN